jgi:hypothetical protein
LGIPIIIIATALLATDPDQAMKNQLMDWHMVMFLLMWGLHLQRTVIQLMRMRRIQKWAEKKVNLIDILSDSSAVLLFEKHLIAGTFSIFVSEYPQATDSIFCVLFGMQSLRTRICCSGEKVSSTSIVLTNVAILIMPSKWQR